MKGNPVLANISFVGERGSRNHHLKRKAQHPSPLYTSFFINGYVDVGENFTTHFPQ